MNKSPWPDFIFTITVRFVCGIVLGAGAFLLFSWRGVLRAFAHDNTYGPLIWFAVCGLAGGLVAVFTVPRWQTPWYRREPLNLGAEFESLSHDPAAAPPKMIKKSITIKTVGEDGQEHEYSSLDEAPPEIRSQLEALEKEADQERGNQVTVTEVSQAGHAITSKVTHVKNISVYKIVDESGVEQVYHSLEEMPPEIRAALTEAEKKSNG